MNVNFLDIKKDKRICDPIDEEHCRRRNSFLLVNRLKTIVPVRSSRDGVGHRSIPALIR